MNGITLSESNLLDYNSQPCLKANEEQEDTCKIKGNLARFKALLGTNFDGLDSLKLNGKERQEILEILIRYFELHLPIFQKPKSLTILKTVFA